MRSYRLSMIAHFVQAYMKRFRALKEARSAAPMSYSPPNAKITAMWKRYKEVKEAQRRLHIN